MSINIEKAMKVEKEILVNRTEWDELDKAMKDLGFSCLREYFDIKREHLFSTWNPEVYYVDISEYAAVTEDAIQNGKYGIYISNGDGIHAYHGSDEIDYELCKELDVLVVELNYGGGTIIGSADDLSIIIVFPRFMNMNHPIVLRKFVEIISKYVPNTTINGNDILVDGNKVSGSMTREVGDSFVWAAQVSFREYTNYISKICSKTPIKTPSYIDSNLLTRDKLEEEILAWLQNK